MMEKRLKGAVAGLSIALGMLGLVIIVFLLFEFADLLNALYGKGAAIVGFVICTLLLCSILGFLFPGTAGQAGHTGFGAGAAPPFPSGLCEGQGPGHPVPVFFDQFFFFDIYMAHKSSRLFLYIFYKQF